MLQEPSTFRRSYHRKVNNTSKLFGQYNFFGSDIHFLCYLQNLQRISGGYLTLLDESIPVSMSTVMIMFTASTLLAYCTFICILNSPSLLTYRIGTYII